MKVLPKCMPFALQEVHQLPPQLLGQLPLLLLRLRQVSVDQKPTLQTLSVACLVGNLHCRRFAASSWLVQSLTMPDCSG